MKTKFQQTFKKEHAAQIVKIFHPDLTDEQINKYIKFGAGSYDWCQIEFNVPMYGRISIGLDNGNQNVLWGPGHKLKDFQNALDNGDVTFRCWRFSMDKLANQEKYGTPERHALEQQSADILKKHYQLQSAQEMLTEYYDD